MCVESVGQAGQQVSSFLLRERFVVGGVGMDVPTCRWLSMLPFVLSELQSYRPVALLFKLWPTK